MATKKHNDSATLTDKQAEDILESVGHWTPILTEDLVWETDRVAQSAEFGVARRMGLMTLSKDGAWFRTFEDMPRDTAEAMACGVNAVKLHIEKLKTLTGLLETAELRLMVALCARQDCGELMAHAAAHALELTTEQSNG